ncbi:hypothetical protein RIF29_22901 [Crotalaria pallida]|uniref:Uncharacterized protein n=1 Tax=Crotalaria pallida TaxID=3830 RepID=A0AAN9F6Y6_CROPI
MAVYDCFLIYCGIFVMHPVAVFAMRVLIINKHIQFTQPTINISNSLTHSSLTSNSSLSLFLRNPPHLRTSVRTEELIRDIGRRWPAFAYYP